MAKEKTPTAPATLEEALAMIEAQNKTIADKDAALKSKEEMVAEQTTMINNLTNSVKELEGKNVELSAQAEANKAAAGNAVVEYKKELYKVNAGAYRVTDDDGKSTVIVLNKDVLEAKQKAFGAENVRMATGDDIAALLKEKSNLIEKIQK